ncbi:MAG TPA: hypothetical protein VJ398_08270, partial [Acidimicrobiia bacterium]|nr:hypothetical protein [Acidimicrobiia bacterium]
MDRKFVVKRIPLALVAIVSTMALTSAHPGHGGHITGDDDFYSAHHEQHGTSAGHLPASSSNVDLVGKLKLVNFNEDVSDVSALQSSSNGKWYAYLGDWGAKCQTGGVHVVDISNPSNPVKIGFLNSGGTGYVTEGVQALHLNTTAFTGDILVVSNEWCLQKSNPKLNPGGISIWNITNPTSPKRLVNAFGDFDLFGNPANESHSAIAWDTGDGNAYVAAIDNNETFDDVDIFKITNPRKPVLLSETGLLDWAVNQGANVDSAAFGDFPTSHDMDVIKKGSEWHLMVSYWDTGWVDLDVTDPSDPTFVEDSSYAACDQVVTTACPPEGNAHQGEWNADGSLFIGTDEDFTPTRPSCTFDGTGIGCTEFGWTVPVATNFPGGFSGSVVYGGSGCPGSDLDGNGVDDRTEVVNVFPQAVTGADAIAFFRGTCFFSQKVETGELAGYNMVIIINGHAGSLDGLTPNSFFAGGQGSLVLAIASAVMIGHANGHGLFTDPVSFSGAEGSDFPALGTPGQPFGAQPGVFDGWGYVRLLDSNPAGGFTEIDQLAIAETDDPDFATGFGDLTVHEVEVPRGDPNEGGPNSDDGVLAYFSWYAGGFRVAEYDATGISEVGHYIDPKGNNFWGVALAEDPDGNRIVLASDRDYGLFVFRYTG